MRLWQSGEFAKRAPPPRLVVFGSFPGHAYRCAGKAAWDVDGPHYRLGPRGPEFVGPHRASVAIARFHWLLKRAGLMETHVAALLSARFGEPDVDDGRLCIALVKEIAGLATSKGAEFVVLDWRGRDDSAVAVAMSDALRVVSVLEVRSRFDVDDPRYQIPHDGHPSAAAVDLLVRELAQRYGPILTTP